MLCLYMFERVDTSCLFSVHNSQPSVMMFKHLYYSYLVLCIVLTVTSN